MISQGKLVLVSELSLVSCCFAIVSASCAATAFKLPAAAAGHDSGRRAAGRSRRDGLVGKVNNLKESVETQVDFATVSAGPPARGGRGGHGE